MNTESTAIEPTVVIIIERKIDILNEWHPYGTYYHPDTICVARAFLKDARKQYPSEKFQMHFFNRGKEIIA